VSALLLNCRVWLVLNRLEPHKVFSVVPLVLQGAAKEAYSAVIAPGKLEGIAERSWRRPALDSDCIAIRKSPPVLGC
jgi:hypothetical protein